MDLIFDSKSMREMDKNGNLHVANSHITKAQVRPYRGFEVPGYQRLGLDPNKLYKAYCSPEELSKPATVKSLNGIPIQLEHHADFADDPAKETRIGSTGDKAHWNPPYLDNSLHFQDKKAIDRILNRTMVELSLAYRYKPDFTPGETPDGEAYDFVMRDIIANHVALVEEGRAGRDVLVADSSLKEKNMEEEVKLDKSAHEEIEKKEVALANQAKGLMDQLIGLHKEGDEGVEEVIEDEGKGEVEKVIAEMVAKGLSEEDAKAFVARLVPPATEEITETVEKTVTDEDPDVEIDDEDEDFEMVDEEFDDDFADESEEESEERMDYLDKVVKDAISACGMDSEPEEVQRAFAEGVRYGEKKEKQEPKKLDREHESEGEKKHLGEDSMKNLAKDVERRINAKYNAIETCKKTLGKVKPMAFDSAEDVFLEACKREGISATKATARAAYMAYFEGKKDAANEEKKLAQDSKPKASALAEKLAKVGKSF